MQHAERERELTVLVVDDDEEMRNLLKDVLNDALRPGGVRLIEASSGERAMAIAMTERFDLVVLDKELPGMNGLDLLEIFHRRIPEVPVILITAFGGSSVADKAFRYGAKRYLEKPFPLHELLAAVRNVAGPLKRLTGGPS